MLFPELTTLLEAEGPGTSLALLSTLRNAPHFRSCQTPMLFPSIFCLTVSLYSGFMFEYKICNFSSGPKSPLRCISVSIDTTNVLNGSFVFLFQSVNSADNQVENIVLPIFFKIDYM